MNAPSTTRFLRLNQKTRGPRGIRRVTSGSSAFRIAASRSDWFSNIRTSRAHKLQTRRGGRDDRREIEQHTDLGTECVDRLQLKAADLGHGHRLIHRCSDQRKQRRADISADNVGISAVFKMCATREVVVVLPFEPVMATVCRAEIAMPTRFRSKRNAARARQRAAARFAGTPGTDNDQILFKKVAAVSRRVPALRPPRATSPLSRSAPPPASIGGSDLGATGRAEKRNGHTRPRQSHDQHALPLQNQTRVSRSHSPQFQSRQCKKRKYQRQNPEAHDVFGSLQPLNSKW